MNCSLINLRNSSLAGLKARLVLWQIVISWDRYRLGISILFKCPWRISLPTAVSGSMASPKPASTMCLMVATLDDSIKYSIGNDMRRNSPSIMFRISMPSS